MELIGTPREWSDAVARRDGEATLLVEEFVAGPEYSWEGLAHDGRVRFGSVTRKQARSSADRLAWALLDCGSPEELESLVARLRAVTPLLRP
ncbi:hypothetical protein AB0912_12370 [Streptomyces sp. NPDC007084]|uniref:hypothetical protein n=1 Tax=Streptomyces sp. NPDC007084 TaxID=3154313 RepID=UPI0034530400